MTRFNTQLVHGLPVGDNNTGAVNPPIYNSTTYAFERVDAMPRYDYARSGNPTRDFLEQQIAMKSKMRVKNFFMWQRYENSSNPPSLWAKMIIMRENDKGIS